MCDVKCAKKRFAEASYRFAQEIMRYQTDNLLEEVDIRKLEEIRTDLCNNFNIVAEATGQD